jgi:hypothetical protein
MIITKQILDFLTLLENINTISDLKFCEIVSVNKTSMDVAYFGHEEGGSYVYKRQVVPQYIIDLEWTLNCKVEWLQNYSYRTKKLHWGSDLYIFKIYYNKIVKSKKYKPKGDLIRINAVRAFVRDTNADFAYLHLLYTYLLNNKKNYGNISLNGKTMMDGDKPIAHVVRYNEPDSFTVNGHNVSYGRTHWDAEFDYVHEESRVYDVFFRIYKRIINDYLQELKTDVTCTSVFERHLPNTGPKIHINFSHCKIFVGSADWKIYGKEDIKMILDSAITEETYDKYYRRKNIHGHSMIF